MIKETEIKQITENIQYKFNNLLEESLNRIEESLCPTLYIYNKNNKQSFPKKLKYIKQVDTNISNTKLLEIKDFLLYFEEVNSDIGDFYIIVSIENKNIKNYAVLECISSIIKYIIKQSKRYIELDIKGLLEDIENRERCKEILKNLYNHDFTKYISYCKDITNHEKYYKDYIQNKYIELYTYMITGKDEKSKIIDHLNYIASTPYESKYIKNGKLAIFRSGNSINNYINDVEDLVIEFPKELRVEIKDYKAVRKIIEMSDENLVIVSDGVYIYGIAFLTEEIEKIATIVRFNGYSSISINTGGKNIKFKYGNIINTSKVKENSTDKAIESIEKLFTNLTDEQKKKLTNVIEKIKQQEKGSMLIVSNNAVKEADRLKYQSTLIKPKEISEDIIKSISKIDGSIIIDENTTCHAIGVIIDGVACEIGDKSRGARFNSAIKYIDKRQDEAVAIVVSEDKMIDIIDKERISKLKEESKNRNLDNDKIGKVDELEILNDELQYSKTITENDLDEDISILMSSYGEGIDVSLVGALYFKLQLPKKYTKYLKKSTDLLEKQIKSEGEDGNYFYYIGINYMYLNKFEKSIDNIQKAIDLDKNNEMYKYQLGMVYMKKEEYELAIKYLEEATDIARKNKDTLQLSTFLYNLGVAYYKSDKSEKSKKCLVESIDLDKNKSISYYYLGHVNRNLGYYEDAKNNYLDAIELNSSKSNYYHCLGNAYYENGEFQEAIPYYEKAHMMNPDEILTHIQLRDIYICHKNDLINGARHLREMVRLEPENLGYLDQLGNICIEIGHYQNEYYEIAKTCYIKATKLDSSLGYLFNNLGIAYNRTFKFKEAIKNFEEAMRLEPRNPQFCYNISSVYWDQYIFNSIRKKSKGTKRYLIKTKEYVERAIDFAEEGSELYLDCKRRLSQIEE